MKKFFADFKKFATKGNVMDMAIGVVIGSAFGKITSSLVNDIIMPLISLITGGVSVADWKWVINPAVIENGAVVTAETALRYGMFLQSMLDFLIIAFSIFLVLRLIMKAREKFGDFGHAIAEAGSVKRRELKKQGYSKKDILKMEKETMDAAKAKAMIEKEIADAEAKANSSETLLKEIRDLLKANAEKTDKTNVS